MKFHTNKNGYSLVEVLVAITILMLAIVGPLTIAARGLQSSQFAKDQTTAFLLAQEGIEAFVAIRNQEIISGVKNGDLSIVWDWVDKPSLDPCFINDSVTFISDGDVGCNVDFHDATLSDGNSIADCSNLSDCLLDYDETPNIRAPFHLNDGTTDNDSKYTRVITLENVDDKELKITSTVSWAASVYGGTTEDVELTSYIYKLYETP